MLDDWGKYMVIELADKFAQSKEFTLSFFLHLTSFLISLGLNCSYFRTKKGGDEATDCYGIIIWTRQHLSSGDESSL